MAEQDPSSPFYRIQGSQGNTLPQVPLTRNTLWSALSQADTQTPLSLKTETNSTATEIWEVRNLTISSNSYYDC